MPYFQGRANQNPSINRADVGEKLVALGSGFGEGAIDLATMPVRLGSIAAKEMGLINNRQMLNNIQTLDDASYAPAEYMDKRQAMRANPNTAALGSALAPMPAYFNMAKRLYGASAPVNKNVIVKGSDRGADASQFDVPRDEFEQYARNKQLYRETGIPF